MYSSLAEAIREGRLSGNQYKHQAYLEAIVMFPEEVRRLREELEKEQKASALKTLRLVLEFLDAFMTVDDEAIEVTPVKTVIYN